MTTITASTLPATPAAHIARDSLYLLTGFPLAVLSFTVLVTGVATGAGLLITLAGIPVLVATLLAARGFAAVERQRLRWIGVEVPPAPAWPPASAGTLRRWLVWLRNPQAWLDVVHGLLVLPVSVVTFSVIVTWWSGAAAGLTAWWWMRYLPPDSSSLADQLHLAVPEAWLNMLIGLFFALTLYPVARGCALTQTTLATTLLGNRTIAQLTDRVARLTETRSAAVVAEVDALRRIERDIHDGPQQRLVRLDMDLAAAERRLTDADPAQAARLIGEARDHTAQALAELRALSRGIAPPILTDRGLAAALTELTSRSGLPAHLDVALPAGERLPAPVETALYFTVSEALTNVAKHSGAREVRVAVRREGRDVVASVTDDGRGGAALAKGHGLAGLTDRLAALDGTLEVTSPTGGGTAIRAVVPCG